MEKIFKSVEETKEYGRQLTLNLVGGEILALFGDLGSGKTVFTKGIAEGLGFKQNIISPTFNLIKVYAKIGNISTLCHADLYRLENSSELENIGISEYIGKPDTICVIEWPEKIEKQLPNETIKIYFSHIDEEKRKIEIK
ncbi:MAG: tRNA (adenosine(37)-N6)-threonylcarbamoyltransferase complex ATPase subunit type 1 TsaE [Patescibacteria group bacterium]|jgi:tRNA threonylcarbamoyladenosine biosynthesis protein TsaE